MTGITIVIRSVVSPVVASKLRRRPIFWIAVAERSRPAKPEPARQSAFQKPAWAVGSWTKVIGTPPMDEVFFPDWPLAPNNYLTFGLLVIAGVLSGHFIRRLR